MSFSRGSSQLRDQSSSLCLLQGQACSLLLEPPGKLDREEGELSNLLKVTLLTSVESGSEP